MGVHLVLLTLGASFDVFLYILSQLRPPVVFGYQLLCSVDTGMSIGVTISDLAIFNFLLRYDVASEVSPTWLTPVYLLFVQVAVT